MNVLDTDINLIEQININQINTKVINMYPEDILFKNKNLTNKLYN